MSSGRSLSKRISSPVTGCSKPRSQACSAWRGKAATRLPRRFRQQRRLGGEAGAIGAVADHRMADRRHVDADLVGAAGLQAAFDQGGKRPVLGPEALHATA